MKNLKRTLSLVLALVLAVGLLTVGAGAAFKDDADVTYKEAVDLLNGLGVINGYEDGSFRPTETFNRAGLAKMVAYFSWGGKDLSNYYTGLNIFADYGDSSTNWAKGPINYGYNAGYIAGAGVDKDNKLVYNPAGTVKGSELAKTLLCVLGYNPKSSNVLYALEGANWELNSIRLAQQEGLFDGLKADFDPTAPLTREEAAQIFMNALTARMVKDYKEDGSPKEFYEEADGTLTRTMLTNTFKYSNGAPGTGDAFMRPTTNYTKSGSDPITVSNKAVLSYTGAVTGGKLYTDLGRPTKADGSQATYTAYEDGVTTSSYDSAVSIVSGNSGRIGGPGAQVEVYRTLTAGEYVIVVINTYVGTISDHTDAVKNADGEITTKEKVTVTADSVKPGSITTSDFDTTAFSAADEPVNGKPGTTVLYTYSMKQDNGADVGLQSVEAAKGGNVTVSSVTTGVRFVADGTTYTFARKFAGTVAYSSSPNATNAYDIWFDNYGNVIKGVATSSGEATTGYALVTAVSAGTAEWSDESGTYQAKIITAEGKEAIVTIDKASYDIFRATKGADTYGFGSETALVKFTINSDGEYTFENTDASTSVLLTDADDAFKLDAGVAAVSFGSGDGTTKYANAKTIFFVGTTAANGSISYKAVTGIANMSSIVDNTNTKVAYLATGDVLNAVIVLDAEPASGSGTKAEDIAYLVYDDNALTTTDSTGTYKVYNAVIDSTITTVKVKADYVSTLFNNANVLASSLTYKDGMVIGHSTTFTAPVASIAAQKITAAPADGVITLATAGITSIADNCAVYVVRNGEITAGSMSDLRTDATSVACITTNGIITAAYVVA